MCKRIMAKVKISELTKLTTPSSGDFLIVVDSENNATKKIEASKIINVNASDIISRLDYPRTNFDDIVAEDFELVKLTPIPASSTVRYNHNGYDLYVGDDNSNLSVNQIFISLRYNGGAILQQNEILNVTILGNIVTGLNNMPITPTFLTDNLSATDNILNAVRIYVRAEGTGGANNGSKTINITGFKINYATLQFDGLGDKTGNVTLNQTKTFTLEEPFVYTVFADGWDDD